MRKRSQGVVHGDDEQLSDSAAGESVTGKLPSPNLTWDQFQALTKHLMAVEHGLALLLDLLLPALLGSLHPLQHGVAPSLSALGPRTHLLRAEQKVRPEGSTLTGHNMKPIVQVSCYLRVLLVVQRLRVRVVFADQRIDQQQEEHVEQQSAHH